MKLKFIVNNLLAAAMIAGVSFSVTSCKDTDSDLFDQLTENDADLQKQINELRQQMLQCQQNCQQKFEQIFNDLATKYVTNESLASNLNNYVTTTTFASTIANYLDAEQVQALIDAIQMPDTSEFLTKGQIEALINSMLPTTPGLTESEIENIVNNILNGKDYVTAGEVAGEVAEALTEALGDYLTAEEVQALIDAIQMPDTSEFLTKGQIEALINSMLPTTPGLTESEIENIVNTILAGKDYVSSDDLAEALAGYATTGDLQNLIDSLNDYAKKTDLEGYLKTEDLAQELDQLIKNSDSEYNSLIEALNAISKNSTRLNNVEKNLENLSVEVSTLQKALSDIADAINDLQKQIDALTGRLNSFITSIINQAVYTNLLGAVALPIDVRSNILFTYYGKADNEGEFPTSDTMNAYNGNDGLVLTDQDLLNLRNWGCFNFASDSYEYNGMTYFCDGSLGSIYLTVNPVNVDFNGVVVGLESSNGTQSSVQLSPLEKSDKQLYFGYSRADNGFYRTRATIAPEKAQNIVINIQDGLKDAVVDAVKNRTANDFAHLAKIVYKQMSDVLPCLAVRAQWNDNGKVNAVYSNYNIAATAFKPLSYTFLYDKSFRQIHIPDWKNYEFDFTMPTLNWDFGHITINAADYHVDFNFSDVNISIDDDKLKVVFAEFPEFDADGHVIGTIKDYTVYVSNVDSFIEEFNKQFNDYLKNTLSEDAQRDMNEVVEKLCAEMEAEINKMMDRISTQVNDNIDKVHDDICKEVNDRINDVRDRFGDYIEKVEDLVKRFNKFLDCPNYYMQPTMFYGNASTSFGHMSSAKAFPTQVKVSTDDAALTLHPLSYNAEIIAPAYRKFVAVTDVYTADAAATTGDEACKAVLVKANKQDNMCQVIEGTVASVALTLDKVNGQPTTYEIVYQALDYHGTISTNKYYVTVK